jgi:2-hydroxychromene-2-carboxylate isomerase
MSSPVEFYFDFSSPYGYIASEKIDALASKHGRSVTWRPILLGVVFKTTGMTPLPSIPIKGEYSIRDFARSARFHGLPFRTPDNFPIGSVAASRAFYWLDGRDPVAAKKLAQALYRSYFIDNIDINDAGNVVAVAAKQGLQAEEIEAGINDAKVKDRLRAEVADAQAKGVFGSPYIIVDGEPFWGSDRLDQIDRWLATGGW